MIQSFRNHIQTALLLILCAATVNLGACVYMRERGGEASVKRGDQPADIVSSSATLGAEDVFEVRVFQEPSLSSVYRVSSAGSISFPLIGEVVIEGKTPSQIETEIRERLEKDFLQKAYVSVFVKEFNSKKVFVFGQVQKPGTFRLEEKMSIIQAITLAGGFTNLAAKNSVSITRIVNGSETRITVEVDEIWKGRQSNVPLKPGDIIFVPETLF